MSDFEVSALLLSLKVALTAVAAVLPIAIFIAWALAKSRLRGKALLDIAVNIPTVIPPVVVGFGLLALLGPQGPFGEWIDVAFTWKAAAIAAAVMALPLIVRAVRLSMAAVDPRLEAIARTLGASEWRVFRTITLPLSLPGIVAGTILGFARALAEFGATIAFAANIPGATQTLPLAVYTAMQSPGGDAAATRLALISLAVGVLALVIAEILARRVRR